MTVGGMTIDIDGWLIELGAVAPDAYVHAMTPGEQDQHPVTGVLEDAGQTAREDGEHHEQSRASQQNLQMRVCDPNPLDESHAGQRATDRRQTPDDDHGEQNETVRGRKGGTDVGAARRADNHDVEPAGHSRNEARQGEGSQPDSVVGTAAASAPRRLSRVAKTARPNRARRIPLVNSRWPAPACPDTARKGHPHRGG